MKMSITTFTHVGRNVKVYSHFGTVCQLLKNIKHGVTILSSISKSKYAPKKTENLCLPKKCVHNECKRGTTGWGRVSERGRGRCRGSKCITSVCVKIA
jgi:hypothetical protein